jgi:tetratricopeptide (TPR) repeat protein
MTASRVRPIWRYQYGKLLVENGKAAEAQKQLVQAWEEAQLAEDRSPWTAKSRFYLAEALRKLGQKEAAAEHYRGFLELAPGSSPERSDALSALASLGRK